MHDFRVDLFLLTLHTSCNLKQEESKYYNSIFECKIFLCFSELRDDDLGVFQKLVPIDIKIAKVSSRYVSHMHDGVHSM